MGRIISDGKNLKVHIPTEQREIIIEQPLTNVPNPEPTFQWVALVAVPIIIALIGLWATRRPTLDLRICSNCKKQVHGKNAKFCCSCGNKL